MASFENKKDGGFINHRGKIYIWTFNSFDSTLTVNHSGEKFFSYKAFMQNQANIVTKDFVTGRIEDFLKYGTPTPEISKSESFDGIDEIYAD